MDLAWTALAPGVEPLTTFLIITNVLLGLFVLGCMLLVIRTLFREILIRRRARSYSVTGLGVTLTDGGQCRGAEGHLTVARNGSIQRDKKEEEPLPPPASE
jgi:hypothetical protein